MLLLIAALTVAVPELPGKALPPIKEPEWTAWKDAGEEAKQEAAKAWAVLLDHRPDRPYETAARLQEARDAVDAAYKKMEADKDATCAAGVEAMQASQDDWERMMIATNLHILAGDKGEPFLLWAMANAKSVNGSFEPLFEIAGSLAEKRRPEDLPAVFSILRAHEGSIYLPLHAWYIPLHECLFYVIGRFGREAIPYLYPMLEHPDPYVRRNAAFVLGFFVDATARPTLIKMLAADDIGSGGAAFALGQLGDPEAVQPITHLLKNPDVQTRFSAAYALYEIGSKDALPALEAAVKGEVDEDTRQEMELSIKQLRTGPKPLGAEANKLGKEDLEKALDAAEEANGLIGDVEAIAATAGPERLDQLEEIRRRSMQIPTDKGNEWFRSWTEIIKTVRRRSN